MQGVGAWRHCNEIFNLCAPLMVHTGYFSQRSGPSLGTEPRGGADILAAMDLLWTPWRYRYVTTADKAERPGVPSILGDWPGDLGCVFCNLIAAVDHGIANGVPVETAEEAAGLVFRSASCFVCLNAYPYTSGHVMIIPFVHEASLAALQQATAHELIDLAQTAERV